MNNIAERAKNEYYPNQENNLTLGGNMTQTPNISEFNIHRKKPNNINNINLSQDNYEKLYNEEKLKIEDLEKKNIKLQYINEYLEKELKIEREKIITFLIWKILQMNILIKLLNYIMRF